MTECVEYKGYRIEVFTNKGLPLNYYHRIVRGDGSVAVSWEAGLNGSGWDSEEESIFAAKRTIDLLHNNHKFQLSEVVKELIKGRTGRVVGIWNREERGWFYRLDSAAEWFPEQYIRRNGEG